MACKATTGLTFACSDQVRVGGLQPDFWLGYLSELDTQFSLSQSADINAIDFGSYGGLRKFSGNKYWHQASQELTIAQASGNVSYKQTFQAKLLADSTPDDVILQNLALGNDIFIIFQDSNRQFYIFGAGTGGRVVADAQSSGQTADSDTTDQVTFEAQETTRFIRFARGSGYSDTLNYLNSFNL